MIFNSSHKASVETGARLCAVISDTSAQPAGTGPLTLLFSPSFHLSQCKSVIDDLDFFMAAHGCVWKMLLCVSDATLVTTCQYGKSWLLASCDGWKCRSTGFLSFNYLVVVFFK